MGPEVSGDVRLLRNGNLLFGKPPHAYELALDGSVVWSTEPFDLPVDNHEIYDMPNGNVLVMLNIAEVVDRDGDLQNWAGHELVELTHEGEIVWSWNTFDHLSTLDFDECQMQFPSPSGLYDWTHGNGVVYNATERAVYYSPRHLSRIVKIDYDTGEIIWNMGLDKPSGDVDFVVDLFSFQHSPQILPSGNILLYDNGNRRGDTYCTSPDPYSTAVELKVEPEADEPVTAAWIHELDYFSSSKSDADRLRNGNTLITSGHAGTAIMEEVTHDGELVWRMELPFPTSMYRGERIASLYPLRGDADGDDRIGLLDYGEFQDCFAGADDFAIHRDCLVHDYDEDGDVDVTDFKQIYGDPNAGAP
jgi:hypothetical protein